MLPTEAAPQPSALCPPTVLPGPRPLLVHPPHATVTSQTSSGRPVAGPCRRGSGSGTGRSASQPRLPGLPGACCPLLCLPHPRSGQFAAGGRQEGRATLPPQGCWSLSLDHKPAAPGTGVVPEEPATGPWGRGAAGPRAPDCRTSLCLGGLGREAAAPSRAGLPTRLGPGPCRPPSGSEQPACPSQRGHRPSEPWGLRAGTPAWPTGITTAVAASLLRAEGSAPEGTSHWAPAPMPSGRCQTLPLRRWWWPRWKAVGVKEGRPEPVPAEPLGEEQRGPRCP